MLYDKRWDKTETKPDVFSLENLIVWLEKQPADKVYCYADNGNCLLGQYFIAHGHTDVAVGGETVWLGDAKSHTLPDSFRKLAVYWPRTFGAALKRARAYQRCL